MIDLAELKLALAVLPWTHDGQVYGQSLRLICELVPALSDQCPVRAILHDQGKDLLIAGEDVGAEL